MQLFPNNLPTPGGRGTSSIWIARAHNRNFAAEHSCNSPLPV
jgi:hypothetical protein